MYSAKKGKWRGNSKRASPRLSNAVVPSHEWMKREVSAPVKKTTPLTIIIPFATKQQQKSITWSFIFFTKWTVIRFHKTLKQSQPSSPPGKDTLRPWHKLSDLVWLTYVRQCIILVHVYEHWMHILKHGQLCSLLTMTKKRAKQT